MDKIVLDSSVMIKWFVAEPLSSESRKLLDDYQAGKLLVLAPDLLNAEVANIVWKKHRFQGLARPDADQIIDAFRALEIAFIPNSVLLEDAFHIAIEHQRTVYDALYIALSQREQCPYITADERLVNAISKAFPNTLWVAKWS